jgi:hypothetical protein
MAPTYSSPTTRCATVGRVTRAHGRVHADATLGREADRIGRDRTGECGHSLRRAEVSRNAPIRHCERRRAARSRRRLPDAAAPRRLVLDPQVDHPPTARSPHVRGRAFSGHRLPIHEVRQERHFEDAPRAVRHTFEDARIEHRGPGRRVRQERRFEDALRETKRAWADARFRTAMRPSSITRPSRHCGRVPPTGRA